MPRMHVPIPTAYTKPELKMHRLISSLHVPFVSQEPIHVPDRDAPYIVDFLIMKRIVVEVDSVFHERGRQPMKDERRDEAMRKMNLVILRFANEIIYERPSGNRAASH
jgi:very-short-patch-repair endonuclease